MADPKNTKKPKGASAKLTAQSTPVLKGKNISKSIFLSSAIIVVLAVILFAVLHKNNKDIGTINSQVRADNSKITTTDIHPKPVKKKVESDNYTSEMKTRSVKSITVSGQDSGLAHVSKKINDEQAVQVKGLVEQTSEQLEPKTDVKSTRSGNEQASHSTHIGTRPYNVNIPGYKPARIANVPQLESVQQGKKFKPVSALDFVPRKTVSIPKGLDPEVEAVLQQVKKEQNISKTGALKVPEEFANEDVSLIGRTSFPDGSQWFIVYNKQNNPQKILQISSDGSRILKKLDNQGNVISMEQDGKRILLTYESIKGGKTRVSMIDDSGTRHEIRIFNDRGLLIEQTDQKGKKWVYHYSFENGNPVSYTKLTSAGTVVKKGAYSDIKDIQLDTFKIHTTNSTTTYNYVYNDDGSIKKIIENKGKDNEVVRVMDKNGRIVFIMKKSTGETFKYMYNNELLVKIIVVSSDGSERDIKSDSADFAILESETEQFDPVVFSEMVRQHQAMRQYLNITRTKQLLSDAKRARNLSTAQSYKGSVSPMVNPVRNVKSAKVYKRPVKAPSRPVGIPR